MQDYLHSERISKLFYSRRVSLLTENSGVIREYIFAEDYTPEKAREENNFYRRLRPFESLQELIAGVLNTTYVNKVEKYSRMSDKLKVWKQEQFRLKLNCVNEEVPAVAGDNGLEVELEEKKQIEDFLKKLAIDKGSMIVEFYFNDDLKDIALKVQPIALPRNEKHSTGKLWREHLQRHFEGLTEDNMQMYLD